MIQNPDPMQTIVGMFQEIQKDMMEMKEQVGEKFGAIEKEVKEIKDQAEKNFGEVGKRFEEIKKKFGEMDNILTKKFEDVESALDGLKRTSEFTSNQYSLITNHFPSTSQNFHSFTGGKEYSAKPTVGVSVGLAAHGHGGYTAPVLTILNSAQIYSAAPVVVTGFAGLEMIETCQIALTAVKAFLGALNGESFKGSFKKLSASVPHVHVSPSGFTKDGDSVGLAAYISILSAALEVPPAAGYCFTGAIDADGKVYEIGYVKQKFLAAQQAEIKNIVIPKGSITEEERNELAHSVTKLIEIDCVKEILGEIFPTVTFV